MNKRTIKKILLGLLSSVVMASLSVGIFAENDTTLLYEPDGVHSMEELKPTEAMIHQGKALEEYDKICETYERDENNCFIYPDNYAGEYIDEDYDLVILLTDDNNGYYKSIVSDSEYIKYKTVEYSYNELSSALASSVEILLNEEYGKKLYVGSGIDVKMNKGVIDLYSDVVNSMSETSRQELFEKITSDLVDYSFVDHENETTTISVKGGDGIYQSGKFSAGMGGYYLGNDAIVSCGHISGSKGAVVKYNDSTGTAIGTVSYKQCEDNEYGDYSFITLYSNAQSTNLVYSSIPITGYTLNPPVGTVLNKYGRRGKATVTITQLNYTANYTEAGVAIKGLTKASIDSGTVVKGDSGCPFYYYSTSDSSWKFVGIASGAGGTSYALFTPYLLFNGGFSIKTS